MSSPRSARRKSHIDGEGGNDDDNDGRRRRRNSSSRRSTSRPRRASTTVLLSDNITSSTHEDEIERIREMRARRLRQQERSSGGNEATSLTDGTDDGTPASYTSRRSRRSDILSDRTTITSTSASSSGSNPSRIRSSPMISRKELEDAGLVRKDRPRTSASGILDVEDDDHDDASSYARIRRERLERKKSQEQNDEEVDRVTQAMSRMESPLDSSYTKARKERLASSSGSGSDDDLSAPRREREYRNRDDIEARLAARRSRRGGDDLGPSGHKAETKVGSTTEITLEELKRRREGQRSSRRSGGSSVGEYSTTSQGSGSTSVDGSLSDSVRERIRERAKIGTPLRSKSKEHDMPRDRSSQETTKLAENDEYIDSLEEREARRLERLQRPSRTPSSDLSERLKERREARAAEREARERERNKSASDLSIGRRRCEDRAVSGRRVENSSVYGTKSSSSAGPSSLPDLEFTDDEDENDSDQGWSVRICLVSAMDLPLNVVPNMPLCPVLKMGLVKLPTSASAGNEESATSTVMAKLGNSSVEAVQTARVRTTTPKILSKRDNGTVDFHQEYRWDNVKHPMDIGLCLELCARAVRTPKNFMESPPAVSQLDAYAVQEPSRTISSTVAESGPVTSEPRGLFKRNSKKQAEFEAAEAAAAVARMLIEQESDGQIQQSDQESVPVPLKIATMPQSDYEVTLRSASEAATNADMTEDVRLGSLVIPLTKLPLDKATNGNSTARLEQWYQLEVGDEPVYELNRSKKPSVLLEISFSSPEILDDSEDEFEEAMEYEEGQASESSFSKRSTALLNASFSRRSTAEGQVQQHEQEKQQEESKIEDPVLKPGVIDYIAVVGCRDIGKQKKDDGTKGWVNSSPECVILEQFPPNNDYHTKTGRNALLPEMVQWFCFPEGTRLWRGTSPPSHSDLNSKRFSAASPPNIASSVAAFDACLDCTTSFSWFVIASNSDEYGSSLVKTYGAVIRFYVPAPSGIDPTQDDFAQAVLGNKTKTAASGSSKRLWVPIGICLTSNLPIVGIMEAFLLRICEEFPPACDDGRVAKIEEIHKALANMILNFQKPIAGAVNCSVPFLEGDRFLLSLPPPNGLPPLPHGRAVISACRLLGADGLNFLIAAVLTECKILIHSQEIADIAMVAEVVTALTYPFVWSLPYVPILPVGMLEIVEAPLSYLLGISTCNLDLIDPRALDDVVVVDLDSGFSSVDLLQGRRHSKLGSGKHPTPLPAAMATNLSKAVYKLLRAEEELEEEMARADFGEQILPRLEGESLPEREFRVAVAVEIAGLLRGYQDCVGPVFNRDKFLKTAPALFEERREIRGLGTGLGSRTGSSGQSKTVSVRSKRFLSLLVNGQNFQQLLETLESTTNSFFHEIMEVIDGSSTEAKTHVLIRASSGENGFSKSEKNIVHLVKSLQKDEDKIPTYRVEHGDGINGDQDEWFTDGCDFNEVYDFDTFPGDNDIMDSEERTSSSFATTVLSPIEIEGAIVDSSDEQKQSLSMEYLAKLETNPWTYNYLFQIPCDSGAAEKDSLINVHDKVKLRDAIGERRFRAWKAAQDQKPGSDPDLAFLPEHARSAAREGSAIDLTSLVTSAKNDMSYSASLSTTSSDLRTTTLSPEQQRVADAKSRDIIRRCLDRAQNDIVSEDDSGNVFIENGRDLMAESEKALRNPSAQRFLLKILAQRSRLESQKLRSIRRQSVMANSASRLEPVAFNCLVRLSCAMLDSCMEFKEFELAYHLLTNTAGFIMVVQNTDDDDGEGADGPSRAVITMTSRIGLHPIFADLGLWETVMSLHLKDRKSAKRSEDLRTKSSSDEESADEEDDEVEYEAAVATLYEMVGYGIPGEELSRFAMRASEEHGWFCDDRGRQLLMLARRISIRRDQFDVGGAGETGDFQMVRKSPESTVGALAGSEVSNSADRNEYKWKTIGWCHPAAPSSRILTSTESENVSFSPDDFMKRSAVTALASFGSSMVVTGGLDGGVFLAHSISDGTVVDGLSDDKLCLPEVRGIHLDWGSASRAGTGISSDGEYGVGAVSSLAAAYGGGQHSHNVSVSKDTTGASDDADIVESMEGSRIIAGTTAGDLRVWSVKDIYSAVLMTNIGDDSNSANSSTRLKFSLRGRALSGHRGGVTCIDVPSQVYRPDSLVTGGADGLIKIWSLRAPSGSRRSAASSSSIDSEFTKTTGGTAQQSRGRGGDALSTLTGHTGRVLCIKTAWHGDNLLSGGADRTVRVWDLATGSSGGGKCLHRLWGHFGWVTNVQYWGPNTIVSASTDRSVALWDARVRETPLFMLRYHHSPISDLLVGSRTDPYMVSAGTDGTIATWDFRSLSDSTDQDPHRHHGGEKEHPRACTIVRNPSLCIRHGQSPVGSVQLARSITDPLNSFFSVGSDAIVREWSIPRGEIVEEFPTGHCDAISSFGSFVQGSVFGSATSSADVMTGRGGYVGSSNALSNKGVLTSSWDGTIRMRKLVKKDD